MRVCVHACVCVCSCAQVNVRNESSDIDLQSVHDCFSAYTMTYTMIGSNFDIPLFSFKGKRRSG